MINFLPFVNLTHGLIEIASTDFCAESCAEFCVKFLPGESKFLKGSRLRLHNTDQKRGLKKKGLCLWKSAPVFIYIYIYKREREKEGGFYENVCDCWQAIGKIFQENPQLCYPWFSSKIWKIRVQCVHRVQNYPLFLI